jgi:hypothetical protein
MNVSFLSNYILGRTNTSSISFMTIARNTKDSEKIAKIRRLQDKEKLRYNMQHDTKALLVKTEQQLRTMKYKLTMLVSNGEGHADLLLSHESKVEVFPTTLVYARVPCKNKTAPLKINFKYSNKGDIKIF